MAFSNTECSGRAFPRAEKVRLTQWSHVDTSFTSSSSDADLPERSTSLCASSNYRLLYHWYLLPSSNHPVIKDDGVLASFLSEAQFDHWRKATNVSLEEESASKRVDRNEEMSIPSDLEEKLAYVLPPFPSPSTVASPSLSIPVQSVRT